MYDLILFLLKNSGFQTLTKVHLIINLMNLLRNEVTRVPTSINLFIFAFSRGITLITKIQIDKYDKITVDIKFQSKFG